MNSKAKIVFFIVLFILIIVGVGFYIWRDWRNLEAEPPSNQKETVNLEAEPPSEFSNDQNIPNDLGVANDLRVELLNRLTRNIPKGTNPEIISQIQELSQTLKDNFDYLQGWLQLGILRKNIGDFGGAAEAWQYAIVIRPDNSIAYLNLGDLYGYYFHDNQKAEANLLKAIKIEPTNIYAYQKTYEFYTDTNQSEKARRILEQGIAANPDTSQSLRSILSAPL